MNEKKYVRAVLTFEYTSDVPRAKNSIVERVWKSLKRMEEEDFKNLIRFE